MGRWQFECEQPAASGYAGMDLVYHRLRRLVAYQPDDKIRLFNLAEIRVRRRF